jgi:hypothetical protein
VKKLGLVMVGIVTLIGITQIMNSRESGVKKITYETVNKTALNDLKKEVSLLKSKINQNHKKPTTSEISSIEIKGRDNFIAHYQHMMEWMKENKVLYRHQVSRSFDALLSSVNQVQVNEVNDFNYRVQSIVHQHMMSSRLLKFSPEIIAGFQEKLTKLLNPLEVKRTYSVVPNSAPKDNINFDNLNNTINDLTQERTVSYETHAREPSSQMPIALAAFAGLVVGIAAFATLKRNQVSQISEQSDVESLSSTMKKVLKEINYPILVCDQNFNINWENAESEKLKLKGNHIQNILSDSKLMDRYELDGKTYTVKVEDLKYKSGKVSYLLQMIPLTVSPRVLSHVVNQQEIERVLENSLKQKNDFKGLNQLVAENAVRMNYLFKVSAKLIDVDFDENLSECFIESNRLNEAVREFMMANYHLIKDNSLVSGLYMRTSEKGQRFHLNCFIPGLNKDSFAQNETSRELIQKLSTLESKFNLYYPRLSFRWVTSGEVQGVDICLSLENKSELETLLRESNA